MAALRASLGLLSSLGLPTTQRGDVQVFCGVYFVLSCFVLLKPKVPLEVFCTLLGTLLLKLELKPGTQHGCSTKTEGTAIFA
jgi:hypothetical protein